MARNINLEEAASLVRALEKLSGEAKPEMGEKARSGDLVISDQVAVFGKLLVALARYMDQAQRTVILLTAVVAVLTAILALDIVVRIWHSFQ